MRRIVHRIAGAAGAAVLAVAGAGCGAHRSTAATPAQRLAAAALSEDEVPAGYLPAENAAMFRGLRPADPDCRALLALAAAPPGALGAVPRVDTSYYQVDPGGWVAEHLLLAAPLRANAFLLGLRRAAAGCDRIVLPAETTHRAHSTSHPTSHSMSHSMSLRRGPLPVHGIGEDGYTVRYSGWAGVRHRVHLDIVTARPAGRLLVLTAATLLSPRKTHDLALRIAERAVGKLRGAASIG
jgi:hypothetical protein